MGMMSASLPASSSTINDVIALLEFAQSPSKLKKSIEDLKNVINTYEKEKVEIDLKMAEMDNKQSQLLSFSKELEKKSCEFDEKASVLNVKLKELSEKEKSLKKLESELSARQKYLENETHLNNLNQQQFLATLNEKEIELAKQKEELEQLRVEFREKVEKLKAVTDLME